MLGKWAIPVIASILILVTLVSGQEAYAAFPGENGKIVFSSDRESSNNFDLFVMNSDGSGQTKIFESGREISSTFPMWSPDGTKIVFQSTMFNSQFDIFVINADGTGLMQITNTPTREEQPAWSQDGTKIVYRKGFNLFIIDADGTGEIQLTNGFNDSKPDWSPDGTKIAFHRILSPQDVEIFLINPDGTGEVQLTNAGTFSGAQSPSWSPDGNKIAFVKGLSGLAEIFIINSDGTGETAVTANSFIDRFPKWSPDGTKIVFDSLRLSNLDIFVISTDGSGETRLTTDALNKRDIFPDWQPLVLPPPPVPIGGTLVPIDTTTLLLAGVQSISMWLIPVVAAGIGIGIFVIKRRK